MQPDLEKLAAASEGLTYMSETDAPFEVVELGKLADPVKTLSGLYPGAEVETVTLDHFFRHAVKVEPGSSSVVRTNAERFQALAALLKKSLGDIRVYRVGTINIDALIIGRLADGSYGGLKTKLVET
jgi:hypothetical protein